MILTLLVGLFLVAGTLALLTVAAIRRSEKAERPESRK
jgi:hypothetical protein